MVEKKMWIITTSSERPARDIASDLHKAGLSDGKVLEEIGTITGLADDKVVEKLRKVTGVKDVSPDLEIKIPPPESPIQ